MNISTLISCIALGVLTGCSSYPGWIASSGPNRNQVLQEEERRGQQDAPVPVVEITDAVARQLQAVRQRASFAEAFGHDRPRGLHAGPGDVLEVSIWEAPPAALFGAGGGAGAGGMAPSRTTVLPEQMVSHDGMIDVPFAGSIAVQGKSTQEIAALVAARLQGKANQPQVMVRMIRNATANVTVVGEVAQSQRMPLTAQGERLLDAVAAAGGVRAPVGKTVLQVSRAGRVLAMPLEAVIQNAAHNVHLMPGDVLTALSQSASFTVLGAAGRNAEIDFEAQGITLAQALARAGGLRDNQADARGLFIFRFEDADAVAAPDSVALARTPEGRVPVIYQLDMKKPQAFLVAQNFPVKDRDVIYIANAPSAELQKFLSILTSSIYSVRNIVNINE